MDTAIAGCFLENPECVYMYKRRVIACEVSLWSKKTKLHGMKNIISKTKGHYFLFNEKFKYFRKGKEQGYRRVIIRISRTYNIENQYDFIIVGSGPAGCVLAHRLSENPSWKVLLIEAGSVETFLHRVPVLAGYFQLTTSNWNYLAEPEQNACLGMNNNQCALPRGRILGGTSAINYMIYNRGNRLDFDKWAEDGNHGWSYNDILPYFLKTERANLKGKETSRYHNRYGLLSVEDVPFRTGQIHAFVQASKEAGLREIDYNGARQLGISYLQSTTYKGQRHSAARAYLEPVKNRRNLHIMLNTRVTKVFIEPKTKVAYGVELLQRNKLHKITALKEIILSSGSFNSPQLLMLSGVGPADHLKSLRIPVLKDLPVGQIMFDHLSHFGPTFTLNSTGNTLKVNDLESEDIAQFVHGKGLLTLPGGVEGLAFVKTPKSGGPPSLPDIELIFTAGSFASDDGSALIAGANIKKEIYNSVYKPLEKYSGDHFTILVMLFHPKSFGYIQLRDTNPLSPPKIYTNYLKNPEDVETLVDGIKEAVRISQSPVLKKLGAKLYDRPLPNCRNLSFASDEYWRCSVRTLSYTLHHQVATCKMGPSSDPMAIVSPELRVHGIRNLRVADTSIIPRPPTSHTNAASFMIGEKAADLIKQTWNL